MTKFRPCIDLHAGRVKQIVGGTLDAQNETSLRTNFISDKSAGWFAALYREYNLTGAHIILLGPGNDEAAEQALQAWPGGLQVGGGINASNARNWIDLGADKVIITSYLFPDAVFSLDRLHEVLESLQNDKTKLVIDISCRKKEETWFVATNKWQTVTAFEINQANIKLLEEHCSEFLIHAADVEGLQEGIDTELVAKLAEWSSIPVTYAGGARHLTDLDQVRRISNGQVDLTIGSALDIFGGSLVKFTDCVEWNNLNVETQSQK